MKLLVGYNYIIKLEDKELIIGNYESQVEVDKDKNSYIYLFKTPDRENPLLTVSTIFRPLTDSVYYYI